MSQGEFDVKPDLADANEISRRHWGRGLVQRLVTVFRVPTPEESEAFRRAEMARRYSKYGASRFFVIRSLEGSLSTAEQVRGLYPADSLPEEQD